MVINIDIDPVAFLSVRWYGIAEKGFDLVEELWQATLKAITECPCQEGCPSCIQSPKCGNNNRPLDKKAAQILLGGLLY